MTVTLPFKDENEVVDYRYDWSGRIGSIDPIVTHTLTVDPNTATTTTLSNATQVGTVISFTLSGGANGETAFYLDTITTASGLTLEETLVIGIRSSALINAGPSTSTKRQIVQMAYENCGLASYEFDLTPEEYQAALRRLDGMMAQWEASSIYINYNFPIQFGGGSLDSPSGIPDNAVFAAAGGLALLIAPMFGKTISGEVRVQIASAMTALRASTAFPPQRVLQRNTPVGAGNKPWSIWQPFAWGRDDATNWSGN